MSNLFLKIINMSISASWLVLAVLLLRFVLKKAPKWVNVLLWAIVAVRLICPFSIESALSLIPSAETISPEIMMDWTPEISTGMDSVDRVVNPIITETFAPEPIASANPLQILIPVCAVIWITGMCIMALYTAVSYLRLRRKVSEAVILRENIYQSENTGSPFVLGVFRPRIYLPYHMDGQDLNHVVAHEKAHIRRRDHWWKPLGFLLLTIHWFNPLMWLAYVLLCRDIELACDEKVIKDLGNEQRADYTQALVACSVNRRMIAACPLAFGEVGVKERVKSVMNYKKPAFWIIVLAVIACVVVAVCFLTNPIGFQFDEATHTIVSANHFDMRTVDDAVAVEMNSAQLSELSSRLAGVKNTKKSNEYGGFTPGYQISALLEDGTYIRISGYSLSENDMVDIEWNGDRYVVSDSDFQDYLSRICAGEDVTAAFAGFTVNHPYGVVEVSYESPLTSFSMVAQVNTPNYMVDEECHLFSVLEHSDAPNWTDLGELTEFALSKENFDDLFRSNSGDGWFTRQSASAIRKNTTKAWTVIYNQDILYYVLQQKNGELYLAYGYYDYSEKDDPGSDDTYIRWLYKLAPQSSPVSSPVTKWFDYLDNPAEMEGGLTTELPEYPGVTFQYTENQIIASKPFNNSDLTGHVILIGGMPIWNAYFTDLTGDGYPDICATYTYGSGMIDSRIVICDYVNGASYELSDRGYHDFTLWLNENDGQLYVDKKVYPNGELISSGRLVFEDDCIQIIGQEMTTASITGIEDPTKAEGFSYDTAMEKFFENETNEYYFSGIYSQYVIVHYADGTQEDIVSALNAGRATIADLDRFGIRYTVDSKELETAFEANFGGNTSFGQKMELTADHPYWCIEIENTGNGTIQMELQGEVYRVEAGTTKAFYSDEKWKAGTYAVSFSTTGYQPMQGSVMCTRSKVPMTDSQTTSGAMVKHDLTTGDLEVPVENLVNYVFYTNSKQISVTVKGGDFEGQVNLLDVSQNNAHILQAKVNTRENDCLFTGLTSARLYRVDCEGLAGCAVVISGDK